MSSGGGSGLSGLLLRGAQKVFENALNSTMSANATGGIQVSRSFFDLGGGNGSMEEELVIELAGRSANTEVAEIYPISSRAGDLILHGPRKQSSSYTGMYSLYNIILHSTNANSSSEKMYSVFRTESEQEASRMFVIYKQIFPDLVKASPSPLDVRTLEKILKMSSKHESYQAAHIAAALDMVDQLKCPTLRDKLTEQEGNGLLTPLHVACVHGSLDAFRAIAEVDGGRIFNRVYDLEDIKGNNLVHLAANCSDLAVGTAVIKFMKEVLIVNQDQGQRPNTTRILFQLFMKVNNEGNAPIHLACINSNIEAVQLLVDLMDLSVVESNGNILLQPRSQELSNSAAVAPSDKERLLNTKDVASGRTPLHFSVSNPPLLSQLLNSGSNPNIADNDGFTPLHKAVQDSNLKSTLQLLANQANPDFLSSSGSSALHMAASIGAIDCLKSLIVFGVDLDLLDGNGHSARHIVASVFSGNADLRQEALFVLAAAGAKRCTLTLLGKGGCAEGCKPGGRSDGKKPDAWKIKRDGTTGPNGDHSLLVHEAMRGLSIIKESYDTGNDETDSNQEQRGPVIGGRLLSLDGGGIRGLVLTEILFFIEREFGRISGKNNPIISYFDWVAGTSTGGILALALACGKSVVETQGLYLKLKDKVFTGSKPYSASRMEEFLKQEFGADRKMSSINKPRVMIMTSLANRRPPDLYIFRNYVSPASLLGDPQEFTQFPDETYVWETAKVTGAAPSYFTLDHEKFIDGGLIANNPTLDALTELLQFKAVMMGSQQSFSERTSTKWKLPSVVVSLGTGIPPRQESAATNLDIGWPTGVINAIRSVPKLTELVTLLVDQATQAEGQVVERGRAWCTSIGIPFFRFSPEMSADIELDEKQDEVLVNLMWETWCYMVGNRGELKEIHERLCDLDITRTSGHLERMDISN